MEPELRDSLFNDTLKESKMGTNKEKGFGIGLKLCKEFVEKNGGSISIESKPGHGSIFSFTIPLFQS